MKSSTQFYPFVYVKSRQLQIPWNILLIIHLKSRRKNIEFQLTQNIAKDIDNTPPEFLMHSEIINMSKYAKFWKENSTPILPSHLECYFFKDYNKSTKSYDRYLVLKIKKLALFRLMIGNLFNKIDLTMIDDNSFIRKKDIKKYEHLKNILKNEPKNTELLTRVGAYQLIAFNEVEEAIKNLKKSHCLRFKKY